MLRVVRPRRPTEQNRRSAGKREVAKIDRERGAPSIRFRRIIAFAKAMHKSDLHILIAALGRVVQSQAIIEPVLRFPADVRAQWLFPTCALFDERFPLDRNGRNLEDIIVHVQGRKTRLRLGRDVVLPWPWRPSRLQEAMRGLGTNGDWGSWKQDSNHQVVLWEPIHIGWVHGGNHSIATGILLARGSIKTAEIVDISPLYDHVLCDGRVFRRKHDRAVISEVASVELAAIFEIGRLMATPLSKG